MVGSRHALRRAARPSRRRADSARLQGVDRDILRCGRERIRLLGIDAPELPVHCQARRHCTPGDPFASKASLAAALAGTLRIGRFGSDRYDRTLALVAGAHGDLSWWQLRRREVRYRPDWDDGGALSARCASLR